MTFPKNIQPHKNLTQTERKIYLNVIQMNGYMDKIRQKNIIVLSHPSQKLAI
jgi:hypothetical protein